LQNNEKSKNENKSLFLYTALIFIVAIIIIIVAFFGQENLARSQPELSSETPAPGTTETITQKAALISEQNAVLIKQNETLNQLNNELSSDKSDLEAQIAELQINNSNGNILCTIYQYICDDKLDDAREALSTINQDSLTDAQTIIYNNLTKILN
jgi:uncharacterized protein HemX